jgi:hypothetical protein
MPRQHAMLYPLRRKTFERYIVNDPEARKWIDETVRIAQRQYGYSSFTETFDALRAEVYSGPEDPPEPFAPVTAATFGEAITNNEAAGRIMRIVDFRRLSNPQYTDRDLRHELTGTGRSVDVPTDAAFEEEQAKVARANLAEGRTAVQ